MLWRRFRLRPSSRAQVAFDDVFAVLDGVNDLGEHAAHQILEARMLRSIFAFSRMSSAFERPDAVDVEQSVVDSLFAWEFQHQ